MNYLTNQLLIQEEIEVFIKNLKNENIGKNELAAAATIWYLTLGKNRGLVPRHQN